MPIWIAALLGLVEGLTEFLPVSSTGHMILVSSALGLHDDATKTFEVVVQFGAMLAVMVHYRELLAKRILGIVHQEPAAMRLAGALLAAFVPTALVGLALHKKISEHLFKPAPVAAALIVGGVVMIIVDRWASKRPPEKTITRLEDVTLRHGFQVGIAQCFSLWPGTSRSMATIVGGQLSGLSTGTAAEFSFLLAIPIIAAATVLDLAKHGKEAFATNDARITLAVGFVVTFFVSWAVIGLFIRYLQKRGIAVFGFYRLVIGVLVFLAMRRAGGS